MSHRLKNCSPVEFQYARLGVSLGLMEKNLVNHPNRSKNKAERYVLVTTEHRGVFAGYASDTSGDVIALRQARNCIYWSADVKGFLGLASTGPSEGCKIGPAADIELRKITAVAAVTPKAQAKWESAPWAR